MRSPYNLDSKGQEWVATASALAHDVAGPNAAEVDEAARFPNESIDALRHGGLMGLTVPESHGGRGQPPRTFAAVVEQLARRCGSTAMIYVMHVTAAKSIEASTTLADRDALLREIAAGRHLTTLALSEKGSRSQFWAPVSELVEAGEGFRISAQKSWVTSAGQADSYVSSAQKPGAASPMESTLYLARRGSPGMTTEGAFNGLGLRGNDSAPVQLREMKVRGKDLVTPMGDGAAGMLQVILPWFSVGTAAMANGLCVGAVEATAGHLQSTGFDHTGQKLRDLPVLRARLAAMSARTEQARALLGYTCSLMEQPDDSTPLYVLQTRLSSLEAALAVTDLGMKCCGGAAFSRHLPLERLFRDARAGWVMAPTVDHLQDFIGRALTGLPLF